MKRYTWLLILATFAVSWIPSNIAADESKLKITGDLRGRFEGFWYSKDALGNEKDNRRRIRYRLRIDGRATINSHSAVGIRIGSGFDSRSGNQTLGDGVDFGANEIAIRRAYLIIMPFADGKLPNERGMWAANFGRVPNPFNWKNGKDLMLLDGDLNPTGVSTHLKVKAGDRATLFVNAGAFAVDENSSGEDPYFAGVQGGFEADASGNVTAGVRGSFYYFGELDTFFVQRGVDGKDGATDGAGNIQDGLTGDVDGGTISVVETQAFVSIKVSVPVKVFGGYSSNTSAEASKLMPAVNAENTAYNFGIEIGDKKKYVLVGGGYWFIEANAFPSQFIDSDLFDGTTNRKGILIYASRQILRGTDFNVQAFGSDAIETGPEFASSVKASKRRRLQVDLVYKF